ncbi:hypothetical protein NA78x_005990 [Anatilimnocola sp. NA78]|uniref:hypothetical protein n=1 Tax=Anatilimnocola sp. NA78 TaxID=3415683 RepID=UPI003CE4C659
MGMVILAAIVTAIFMGGEEYGRHVSLAGGLTGLAAILSIAVAYGIVEVFFAIDGNGHHFVSRRGWVLLFIITLVVAALVTLIDVRTGLMTLWFCVSFFVIERDITRVHVR